MVRFPIPPSIEGDVTEPSLSSRASKAIVEVENLLLEVGTPEQLAQIGIQETNGKAMRHVF